MFKDLVTLSAQLVINQKQTISEMFHLDKLDTQLFYLITGSQIKHEMFVCLFCFF